MRAALYPVLRDLQSRVPFTRPLKFGAYNLATRIFGMHVEEEFRLLEQMRPVGLALDIGGNWGQSIWALKRTAAPANIISFEPDVNLAARLRRAFAADATVKIEAFALGDEAGEFTLYTPKYRDFIYDGLASLDREEAESWLKNRMAGFDAGKLTVAEQKVPVRTLDSFNLSPDVIKIDVQGAELAVVKGGLGTIDRTKPVAIIESPSQALVDLFATIGLHPYRFADGRLDDRWADATNTVFLSDGRKQSLKL